MEKANKIDLVLDGISTGKFKLDDGQLEAFNDNQPNYIGDFIPNPNILIQSIPNELVWSNDAVVLPISVRLSDDGQRELTLYSDGSLAIKHVNANSLMSYLDREMYNQMLHDHSMSKHLGDEEKGEARNLEFREKGV